MIAGILLGLIFIVAGSNYFLDPVFVTNLVPTAVILIFGRAKSVLLGLLRSNDGTTEPNDAS